MMNLQGVKALPQGLKTTEKREKYAVRRPGSQGIEGGGERASTEKVFSGVDRTGKSSSKPSASSGGWRRLRVAKIATLGTMAEELRISFRFKDSATFGWKK